MKAPLGLLPVGLLPFGFQLASRWLSSWPASHFEDILVYMYIRISLYIHMCLQGPSGVQPWHPERR